MKIDKSKKLKQEIKVTIYFVKLVNKLTKSYLPLMITSSIFSALAPFVNIVIPKFIINELIGSQRIEKLIFYVSIAVLGNALLSSLSNLFDTKVEIANEKLLNCLELHLGEHIMSMDFENIEDPKVLDLKESTLAAINGQGALTKMINNIKNMIQTSITLIGLTAIIASLNIFVIVLIIVIIILNAFIFKKSQEAQFNFHKMLAPLNRQFGYYKNLSSDFSMAKDVRIYNIAPYLLNKIDDYNNKSVTYFNKLFGAMGIYKGLINVNAQIQMIIIYIYMIYKVISKSIDIGDFTMYISAASSFSNNISLFLNSFIEFRQMCKYLDLFMQFESIEFKKSTGNKIIENIKEIAIEFRNVYFKYKGSEKYSLKNVSISIDSGEKLSIVGQNGAGKTTFIKLLCRLYDPDEGEILLNGVNIKEYDYQEYMKLLSVVFQDYKLFSLSIRDNVICNNSTDISDELVFSALKKVGLFDKISTLNKGIETPVYKTFDKNGVELSGGQSQKLVIARAMFKNAPIVILDEPTAALDPFAEYEIFSNLNELVGDKTAIYISHRLSSCRFCDRIAVFDNGEVVEYGHHDELVNAGKKYALMWKTQAQYYEMDK